MNNIQNISIELLNNCMYTQEQLAVYLDVDRTLISKWKNGSRVMNAEQLEKLCDLMGYSLFDLLVGSPIKKINVKFRGNLENSDLVEIAKINKIAKNIEYMERILNENSK